MTPRYIGGRRTATGLMITLRWTQIVLGRLS
jgi:hypothetical protein